MGKNQNKLEQKQSFKLSTKKLVIIASSVFVLCALIVSVLFLFNIVNFRSSEAAGTCSNCDQTISGNSSASINLGNNKKLCIENGAEFTGSVHMGTNSEICNYGTFQPSSLSLGNNSHIENNGTFNYSNNLSIGGFDITNNGHITINGDLTNKGNLISSDSFVVTGKFTNSNSGGVSMNNSGYFSVGGDFKNQNTLTSSSIIIVNGDFENSNSGSTSLINGGFLYVGQDFTNKNNFTNTDSVVIKGNFTNTNSGSSSINNSGYFTVEGDFTNQNNLANTGYFEILGNFSMTNSGSAEVNNDSTFIVRKNVNSNNDIYNNGLFTVDGTLNNQSSNGVIHVGPYSLINADSMVNDNDVVSINTNYGQIIIQSYLENTSNGNISQYVDVCKSSGGNTFDMQNGNVGGTVTFCQNFSPLPVELIYFKAKKVNSFVELVWTTASEKNNDRFEIQRSADGKEYEVIGTVPGAGNSLELSNYSYTDNSPLQGVAYYRLKQIDFDGKTEYSEVEVVASQEDLKKETGPISIESIHPNPFNDHFSVRLNATQNAEVMISLINSNGRELTNEPFSIHTGSNVYEFNDGGGLKAGAYIVRITWDSFSQTKKIIKGIF